jgi:hypothetical protein
MVLKIKRRHIALKPERRFHDVVPLKTVIRSCPDDIRATWSSIKLAETACQRLRRSSARNALRDADSRQRKSAQLQ